jgi:hypothetical protein
MLAHLDVAKVLAIAREVIRDPDFAAGVEASGLGGLLSVQAIAGLTKSEMASAAILDFDGEPKGFFAPGKGALAAADLRAIPADATMAQVVKLDLSALLESGYTGMDGVRPGTSARPRQMLEQVRAVAGFDVDEHILEPLGDTFTGFTLPGPGPLGLPRSGLIVALDDAAAVKSLLGDRVAALGYQEPKAAVQSPIDAYEQLAPLVAPALDGAGGAMPRLLAADIRMLSWRVRMLPYLDEQELYEQFKLDEPWDSDHNKQLIEKMPRLFASPGDAAPQPDTTRFLVPTGKDTMFAARDRAMTMARVRRRPRGTGAGQRRRRLAQGDVHAGRPRQGRCALSRTEGQVGQWHSVGVGRADHEEQQPGLAGLDATLA